MNFLSYLSRKKGILETFLSLGLFISRSRPTASTSKIWPRLRKSFPRFPFFYFGNLGKTQIILGQIFPQTSKHNYRNKILELICLDVFLQSFGGLLNCEKNYYKAYVVKWKVSTLKWWKNIMTHFALKRRSSSLLLRQKNERFLPADKKSEEFSLLLHLIRLLIICICGQIM